MNNIVFVVLKHTYIECMADKPSPWESEILGVFSNLDKAKAVIPLVSEWLECRKEGSNKFILQGSYSPWLESDYYSIETYKLE